MGAPSRALEFSVQGKPAPQGSKNVYRGRVVEASAGLEAWRTQVRLAGRSAMRRRDIIDGPVSVGLAFWYKRPKRPKYAYPAGPPDLDKLCRAVLDALTGEVWRDDALVVGLSATERYGTTPGVDVWVQKL